MKRKARNIVSIFALYSGIVIFIETYSYYSTCEMTEFFRWISSLYSMVQSFIGSPTITIADVESYLKTTDDSLEILMGYLYATAVFIAPLCTLSAVLSAFKVMVFDFFTGLKPDIRPGYIIVGSGEQARNLAANAGEDYRVTVILDKDVTDDEKMWYLRQGIVIDSAVYENEDDVVSAVRKAKGQKIVLDTGDDAENYIILCRLLSDYDVVVPKKLPIEVYVYSYAGSLDNTYEAVFADYRYDNEWKKDISLRIIHRNAIAVKKLFESGEFGNVIKQSSNHVMVVGFGTFGQNLIIKLIEECLKGGRTRLVDVFDADMEKQLGLFTVRNTAGKLRNRYGSEDYELNDEFIAVKFRNEDTGAEVSIRYFLCSTDSAMFRLISAKNEKEEHYDMVALCINSFSDSVNALSALPLKEREVTDIYMRISENLVRQQGSTEEYRGVHFMLDDNLLVTTQELDRVEKI